MRSRLKKIYRKIRKFLGIPVKAGRETSISLPKGYLLIDKGIQLELYYDRGYGFELIATFSSKTSLWEIKQKAVVDWISRLN